MKIEELKKAMDDGRVSFLNAAAQSVGQEIVTVMIAPPPAPKTRGDIVAESIDSDFADHRLSPVVLQRIQIDIDAERAAAVKEFAEKVEAELLRRGYGNAVIRKELFSSIAASMGISLP